MAKRVYNKSTGRDYSYDKAYEKSEREKHRRAKRNRDRRRAIKEGRAHKGDGMDVHHAERGLKRPMMRSMHSNRGDKEHIWS